MNFINSVLLSGWFQIFVLGVIFFAYSSRILAQREIRGYTLGWMIGLFFIFIYASLNPPQRLQFGAYDRTLNVAQIFGVSAFAMFISVGLSIFAYALRDNARWRSIHTAIITSIFVIAIFLQVISEPSIRLMVSLFVLAFGITSLTANILMSRRYGMNGSEEVPYSDYDEDAEAQPVSRLDSIRSRIRDRVNRNNVPTNLPHTPPN